MVQINIKYNSFNIIDDNVSIISSINTTSYSVFPAKNTISFWNTKSLKTLGIYELDDTLVNSKQLTIDNYSEILDPIFKVQSENSINVIDNLESTSITDALSANQGNVLKNLFNKRDYAKEGTDLEDFPNKTPQFGDLVFLTVDGKSTSKILEAYQWNGWSWIIQGAEPNFIFTQSKNKNSNLNNVIYFYNNKDTYFLTLDKNLDYSDLKIYTTDIKLSNPDIVLGLVEMTLDSKNLNVDINNIVSNQFSINSGNYTDVKDSFIIKNCKGNNFNMEVASKSIEVDNIVSKYLTINPYIDLRGEQITIKNSSISYINLYYIPTDNSAKIKSNISIVDNTIINSENMSISIDGNSSEASTDSSITIKNNIGLNYISIRGFDNDSIISEIDMSLPDTISEVNISECNFSQKAFDNFINSLLTLSKKNRNVSLYGVTPLISDDKKQELISLGWSVNI